MLHRCPNCGKTIHVSDEELAQHTGHVVCPQCLTVYEVQGGTLTAQTQRSGQGDSAPAADAAGWTTFSYCYNCGKQLPTGISFCPYCGVNLHMPFSTQDDHGATAKEGRAAPAAGKKAAHTDREENTADVSDLLRHLPFRFDSKSTQHIREPRLHGLPLVMAWLCILALTGIFIAIVTAAFRLG